MNIEALFAVYQGAMRQEADFRARRGLAFRTDGLPYLMQDAPEEAYAIMWRLFENARSEFVSRSYNSRYNLYNDDIVFESVAAHANLMAAVTSHALDYYYGGQTFGGAKGERETVDGYSYREIMEAVRLHDLPENEIGDIPDNGARDEREKLHKELNYFQRYIDSYGMGEKNSHYRVLTLLSHMQKRDTSTGKLLFLADKVSAFLVTLCLDYYIKMPMMHFGSPAASDRDRLEMTKCDHSYNGYYRASEMWTMDFLKIRRHVDLDETMFFTGILVMATLMVNGEWYRWRNEDYLGAV